MQTVSAEVKEIFFEPGFESMLKTLATEFGEDATLKSINHWFQQNRPVPEKMVNGVAYTAGYRGGKMVSEGTHQGTLIDIKQSGQLCKLMFAIDDQKVFLYHNLPKDELRVEDIVRLGAKLNQQFTVLVRRETIPNTGDRHAVISQVDGL